MRNIRLLFKKDIIEFLSSFKQGKIKDVLGMISTLGIVGIVYGFFVYVFGSFAKTYVMTDFGDILAQKIQQNFVPKFIPGEQEYSETVNDYDDSCYEAGLELFDAQKSVIQACVNNFKKSDITFIIGECGSGSKLCKII